MRLTPPQHASVIFRVMLMVRIEKTHFNPKKTLAFWGGVNLSWLIFPANFSHTDPAEGPGRAESIFSTGGVLHGPGGAAVWILI